MGNETFAASRGTRPQLDDEIYTPAQERPFVVIETTESPLTFSLSGQNLYCGRTINLKKKAEPFLTPLPVQTGSSYFLNFFLIPTRHTKPEPRSQAAPGIGTTVWTALIAYNRLEDDPPVVLSLTQSGPSYVDESP